MASLRPVRVARVFRETATVIGANLALRLPEVCSELLERHNPEALIEPLGEASICASFYPPWNGGL